MPPSYRFIRDAIILDDEEIPAGQRFTKAWVIENNGDVPWQAGFSFSHVDGRAMTPSTHVPLPECAPGEQVRLSVDMTAPTILGPYFSDWRLRDASGEFFGEPLWTRIRVVSPPPPVPATGRNDMIYVADVTIEDDQKIVPGTTFTKTWRVKNTGTLPWGPDYAIVFEKGTAMTDIIRHPLPGCAPGDECEISITVTAPSTPGKYYSDWFVEDPQQQRFGIVLWFRIVVADEERAVERADPPKPLVMTSAPHFSQRDKRWRTKRLGHSGSSSTIGSWGCLLTCYAMTASALGHAIDPAQLNDVMVIKGGFFSTKLTSWDALQKVFDDLVFEGKEDQHPGIITRIDAHLANQMPVPVLVDRTPATRYNDNDQHWVLVVARNGDSDYWIYDPIDLEPELISLMERYGRADAVLRSAVRSALFYRRR
jgi:hypothetical protein